MTRFTRWLGMLMLMALPAAATTTTCWDAAAGNVPVGREGGPVTRFQNSLSGYSVIQPVAYSGMYYPAGNPAEEYAFFKTVFPNDGATAMTFNVWGAVPSVTEGGKAICLGLGANVQPLGALSPRLDYGVPVNGPLTISNVEIATPSASVAQFNQMMNFTFALTPQYQTGVDSGGFAGCTHAICDLQPMWIILDRVGTGAYAPLCSGSIPQAVTDAVVATIICITR